MPHYIGRDFHVIPTRLWQPNYTIEELPKRDFSPTFDVQPSSQALAHARRS